MCFADVSTNDSIKYFVNGRKFFEKSQKSRFSQLKMDFTLSLVTIQYILVKRMIWSNRFTIVNVFIEFAQTVKRPRAYVYKF